MVAKLASLLAAASLASAHFVLTYPASIGFEDDKEDVAICGGFIPDFSTNNVTDFYVGGDNIATNLLHPQGTWLYRATLDTAAASNWTQLWPEVLQSGLGKFCQPGVTAPASWAGQQGVINVVVNAPDGLLYQCAAVNFVAGTAPANQADCTNSSGITASFTTDPGLASLADSSTSTSPSASTTESAAAATSSVSSAAVAHSVPLAAAALAVLSGLML